MGHYDEQRDQHDKDLDDEYLRLHGITYTETCRRREVTKSAKTYAYLKACHKEWLEEDWSGY